MARSETIAARVTTRDVIRRSSWRLLSTHAPFCKKRPSRDDDCCLANCRSDELVARSACPPPHRQQLSERALALGCKVVTRRHEHRVHVRPPPSLPPPSPPPRHAMLTREREAAQASGSSYARARTRRAPTPPLVHAHDHDTRAARRAPLFLLRLLAGCPIDTRIVVVFCFRSSIDERCAL